MLTTSITLKVTLLNVMVMIRKVMVMELTWPNVFAEEARPRFVGRSNVNALRYISSFSLLFLKCKLKYFSNMNVLI